MPHSEPVNVLIVDDDDLIRSYLRAVCQISGWRCSEAADGPAAIELMQRHPESYSLALLDLRMPGPSGLEVLPELLKLGEDLAVIIMSGYAEVGIAVEALQKGAFDLIEKPLDHGLLTSRIVKALELREVRRANREYLSDMERQVRLRTSQFEAARKATIFGLARLAEHRDKETGFHLERMAYYTVALATALREKRLYRSILDDAYLENLHDSAPLHDIGKVGVPDSILLKPGPLSPQEFEVMRTHTLIGERALREIQSQVASVDFLELGIEMARSHHEHYDGSGYPDGLAGDRIPLSARLAALADFYDALTTERIYRPTAFPHRQVTAMITEARGTHFDPDIVDAFLACEAEFTRIHDEFKD